MTTTLTNDQITAGAAVLCDHGQPIGRNAAIAVFDAMQAAGPAMADLDLDKLQQHATMFRDIESFHPGHFRTLKIFANSTLDLIALARRAPSPQIAEKVELPPLDEQRIIELWDSTESGGMMGRYVRFAHAIAREAIAASRRSPSPQVADIAELPFISLAADEGFRLALSKYSVDEMTESDFIKFLDSHTQEAIAASRRAADVMVASGLREILASAKANRQWYIADLARDCMKQMDAPDATPAPASAGQAAPADIRRILNFAANVIELFDDKTMEGNYMLDASECAGIIRALSDYLAAQPAEASAGQAGQVAMRELSVWEGAMPESNGKSNFTAVLHRKDAEGFDIFTEGFTISRSEYPDRVRYEADKVRWIIGQRENRPELWNEGYDFDKHSGYVKPATERAAAPADPDGELWRALVRDTEAVPCKYPCLRDDLCDWLATNQPSAQKGGEA